MRGDSANLEALKSRIDLLFFVYGRVKCVVTGL